VTKSPASKKAILFRRKCTLPAASACNAGRVKRTSAQNVRIIGVDSNGAFAEYVVIPESNIWKLDPAIPQEYASILDPLGNAVHSVLADEIAAKTVAITGCGPIGLFSIAVARAVGAA